VIFASTPPINNDPEPYISSANGRRFASNNDTGIRRYARRPEYDRPRAHEANPILLAYRNYGGDAEHWLVASMDPEADSWFEFSAPFATPEQVDHARLVLSRWLAVFA
jgi:hypothetical protein